VTSAVVLDAPAKVNLALEVIGRREDGYHELRSVFATVDLHDRVRVAPARTLDVRLSPPVPVAAGAELAGRAVRALAVASGREAHAYIRIRKRIPVAAGLGGGSSDAGTVLRALARLWQVDADLVALGAAIGSDVPFFAAGVDFALVAGRGERVSPLPLPVVPLWIVLVTLPVRVATASVFAALREDEWSVGYASERLADTFRDRSVGPLVVRELARNDLLAAAERVCPAIAEARAVGERRGVTLALSGSGPTMFAVADDAAGAIRIARGLRRDGLRARAHRLGSDI
jgi:4-diphosphocytidyl-2-C-methyl-D-erythritol kinase